MLPGSLVAGADKASELSTAPGVSNTPECWGVSFLTKRRYARAAGGGGNQAERGGGIRNHTPAPDHSSPTEELRGRTCR